MGHREPRVCEIAPEAENVHIMDKQALTLQRGGPASPSSPKTGVARDANPLIPEACELFSLETRSGADKLITMESVTEIKKSLELPSCCPSHKDEA
jgi:hypothetical protein